MVLVGEKAFVALDSVRLPRAGRARIPALRRKEKIVKIEDIMTRDVRACSPTDTLATAAQIMWENDCGAVPVVDADERIVGIITDRDLAMAAHLQGVALRDSRVSS